MIALPHLIFACVCAVAALIAWPLLTDRADTPLVYAQAVVLGLGAGIVLGAVV